MDSLKGKGKFINFKGITKRWITTVLSITFLILIGSVLTLLIFFHSYSRSAARNQLDSVSFDNVTTFFSPYIGSTEERFLEGASEYIKSFPQKDKMEVWVIDKDGNVVISSSGFVVKEKLVMEDYDKAKLSATNMSESVGKFYTGEKIMAKTMILTHNNQTVGAVRFIVSIESLNLNFWYFTLIIIAVLIVLLSLITLSGYFFIRSIVKPVAEIGSVTDLIASGNFNVRIDKHPYNDEIGQLCESINHMADEIQEADKDKNDFISTVSHELRTPLTAIKGWGETIAIMKDNADKDLMEKGINAIIHESTRLTNMVEELLDFSTMQNGKMRLKFEKIDVLAELDEAIFVFKDRAKREGIDLSCNITELPAPMVGDSDRIKQVFVNLLDNAFKYTEQGGKINVSAKTFEDILKVVITDTGCGIPEKDLPRIKEKFYKGNISKRGAGIGLALCDEIIKAHKGTLDIDSIENEGTTVTISLPIEPVNVPEEPAVIALRGANNDE